MLYDQEDKELNHESDRNELAGLAETVRKKPAPKRWHNNAGRKGSDARVAGMIMATPSPRATAMNAPNVIIRPRSQQGHCFTPPTSP